MRLNEPITDREIVMKDGEALVSKTDAGGRIVFVNQAFIDISGFTEQELIGQPHNLVRHPHMPKEAFADLWATIKDGRAWEGLVKNRTKNGDYYWVRANVTPLVENGAITGFMSVRGKPSREDVAAATGIYEAFRAGKQGRRKIQDGRIANTGSGARLGRLKQSVIARVAVTLIMLLVFMGLIAFIGLKGMADTTEAANSMYADRVYPLQQLKIVADMYAVNIVDTAHKVRNGGSSGLEWAAGVASIDTARQQIDEQWKAYTSTYLTDEETRLKDEAVLLIGDADKAALALKDIFAAKDQAALDAFVKDRLYQAIDPVSAKISELVELQLRVSKEMIDDINSDFALHTHGTWMVGAVGSLIALIMCFIVYRTLKAPVRRLNQQLSAVARGEYGVAIPDDPIVEYQPVSAIVRAMKAQLSYGVLEKRELDQQAAGQRAAALQSMADTVESETTQAVSTVAGFTESMSDGARQMADAAHKVSENSQAVSAAATQMLSSTQTVSSATEELAASIKEIAGQLDQTVAVSRSTMAASESAMGDIRQLSAVVERISVITGVIREVAAQTNLLALNATIEAARAGDAGKGFAVVANEVKNLAAQTANSTTEIERTVDEIRAATGTSVASVSSIVDKIREVDSYASSIASAVEEQSAATSEIARSVGQAADAAKEVAERINMVAEQAELTGRQAGSVNTLATEVDGSIHDLRAAIVRAVRQVDDDVNRRKSKRYRLPMTVDISDGREQFKAEMVDLSMGGARLSLAEGRSVGSSIGVRLGHGVPELKLSVKEQKDGVVRGQFQMGEIESRALAKFIGAIDDGANRAKAAE